MRIEGLIPVPVPDDDCNAVPSSALPGHLDLTVPRSNHRGPDVIDDIEPFVGLEDSEDRMHPKPVFPDRIKPLHRLERGNGREVPLIIVVFAEDLPVTLLLNFETSLEAPDRVRSRAQRVPPPACRPGKEEPRLGRGARAPGSGKGGGGFAAEPQLPPRDCRSEIGSR